MGISVMESLHQFVVERDGMDDDSFLDEFMVECYSNGWELDEAEEYLCMEWAG